jgi:hypothetical protein
MAHYYGGAFNFKISHGDGRNLNTISLTATEKYNRPYADFHATALCTDTIPYTEFHPNRELNAELSFSIITL